MIKVTVRPDSHVTANYQQLRAVLSHMVVDMFCWDNDGPSPSSDKQGGHISGVRFVPEWAVLCGDCRTVRLYFGAFVVQVVDCGMVRVLGCL